MHRPTVGMIALALLAAAMASHVWGIGGEALEGVCLRVGLVMAMLWLALPQTRQLKSKLVIAGLIAVFAIVAFRPKFLPVLLKVAPVFIAVLVVLSLFRRKKNEQDGRRTASGKAVRPRPEPLPKGEGDGR